MFAKNSRYLVALGFSMVLILATALAAIGLSRMEANNQRTVTLLNEQSTKTNLVSAMRNIGRERVIALFTIMDMKDPFDRDEAISHYRSLAGDFLSVRHKFEATRLNQAEKNVFARMLKSIQAVSAAMDTVVDLVLEDKREEAERALLAEAIPSQNELVHIYDELLDLQNGAAQEAVAEVTRANHYTYFFMFVLVTAAISLSVVIAVFVTRRTGKIENALFQEKELAEVTLHSIADGVITANAQGKVEYLNPVAEQLTGWMSDEARNRPLSEVYQVVNEATHEPVESMVMLQQLEGQAVGAEKHALIRRDGMEFAIQDSIAPIRDKDGKVIGAVLVFKDVTEARSLVQQLSWQASHDALTGLANRREFERRLGELLESARLEDKQHVLLYLDLDQFKVVNDTCGHMAGDQLLLQLATLLDNKVRKSDTLARLGGDEFGVLLEGCNIECGEKIAENLRQMISDFRFVWEDKFFEVGVSIGAVAITAASEGPTMIMSAADSACYVAKDEGRNRVQVFFGGEKCNKKYGEMQWISRIHKAIEDNRMLLYRQNIAAIMSNDAEEHAEILLRMQDEDGTIIPPMAFIPAAERFNAMPSIDRWVVKNTLEWLVAHPLSKNGRTHCFAINLSGQSLGDDRFLGYVVEEFNRTGLAPERICFEITETAAIANLSRAKTFIATLKEKGCHFALDDFGSGMSSYSYLKNLDVDYLKIDGSFVKDMAHDPVDFAMVESINRIGHVMGIQTIAEFVEDDAILAKLRDIGVDYAQGYGIHKPEPLTGSA
jgi:diguanylate cyclase (GGDEF)-like protein/PAS domain S-box-containing protein